MATAAMSPSLSPPLVQVTQQRLEDKAKRPREKNVSWATEDSLCQVRLFAAEDAPSLSGTVLQDLLEAKKTRFMHAVIPVSEDDLPPGFEGVAAKRAKLDTAAIEMAAQICWRCPEKFMYDPLWQVVMGIESTEVSKEQQREVRVLEAVYPRPSAIPLSPAELPEPLSETEDAEIPEIPLIPVEDEDDGMEEESLPGAGVVQSFYSVSRDKGFPNQYPDYMLKDSLKPLSGGQSGGVLDSSSSSPVISNSGQANPALAATYFRDADPNVAAAAAAAYAVVKAKESGTLIDHNLLVKILNNPVLIETLTAANQRLKNQSGDPSNTFLNREVSNGTGFNVNSELSGGVYYNSTGMMGTHNAKSTSVSVMQGRQKFDSTFEGRNLQENPRTQPWDARGGAGVVPPGRPFTASGPHEQANGVKGTLGQVKGAIGTAGPQNRSFPPGQDFLKELIQQHGTVRGFNEAQLRHGTSVALDDVKPGHDIERHRASGLGSRGQPWTGNNQNNVSALSSRSDVTFYDRLGNEMTRPRIRKPCLYFNTPRGCRNGANCNFLHDPAPEKSYP